jgi:hypothetical protein
MSPQRDPELEPRWFAKYYERWLDSGNHPRPDLLSHADNPPIDDRKPTVRGNQD